MNELYHHGVPGQKWGVRRYQRKDGTLTRAGKARFKEVSKSKKLQKQNKKDALHILNKTQTKMNKKLKRSYRKSNGQIDNDKIKKLVSDSEIVKTNIKDIKAGTIKAGKDYVVTKSLVNVPYVYIGLTGPKVNSFSIPKKRLVIK